MGRNRKRLGFKPGAPLPAPREQAVDGAMVPVENLRPSDDPSFGGVATQPFDYRVIIPMPASPSVGVVLIGLGGPVIAGRVPIGYRGGIFGFSPYLEGAAGPINTPRIPGAGVAITWKLFYDGRPAPVFENVTNLLDDWGFVSPYLLAEIPEAAVLTVTLDSNDPIGLYTRIGIRVRGYWEPWKRDPGKASG